MYTNFGNIRQDLCKSFKNVTTRKIQVIVSVKITSEKMFTFGIT